MPNTIAHFAVSGLLTRTLIRNADLKWVYVGCVLPDIPWILQRLVLAAPWAIDTYHIRAYAITQSSLLLCLVLSTALAFTARNTGRVFVILSLGSLIHLLLDATQIKWANGVLLLAPFDWHLLNFGMYWPESLPTYSLTLAGAVYFIFNIRSATEPVMNEFSGVWAGWLAGSLALIVWLTAPLMLMTHPYDNDHHYISTLQNVHEREGKLVEFDRNGLISAATPALQTAFGELIYLSEPLVEQGEVISLRGRFIDNNTVQVSGSHVHSGFRNKAAIVGLAMVLAIWLVFFIRLFRLRRASLLR